MQRHFLVVLLILLIVSYPNVVESAPVKTTTSTYDPHQVGLAPNRKCPAPQVLDPAGKCRTPWGR